MSSQASVLINTRLQPGVAGGSEGKPFQRFASVGKPLKRFLISASTTTGLKPGVNEMEHNLSARFN